MIDPNPSILSLLKRLWRYLNSRRKKQFEMIMIFTLVSALAEVVSLGSVLPFLAIVVAPDQIFQHLYVADMAQAWGFTEADQLILPLTIAFASAALIAGTFRILLLWASTRLAYASGADFSLEVYRRTLNQPYEAHLARNSSEVISAINNKIDIVINVLFQLMNFISSSVLLVLITFALITIAPVIALFTTLGFGFIYGLITWIARRRLYRNSQRIAYEQTHLTKTLQESLGGIRDLILDGTQQKYCKFYSEANYPFRSAQSNNTFITFVPRLAIEALTLALIAVMTYALIHQNGGIASALPLLGALALGAQRLLPALQQIYAAWAFIAGSRASIEDILEMLDQPLPAEEPEPEPLFINNNIRFDNVHFRYHGEDSWVLSGLNLTILKGSRVGLVGITGSGKSTVFDLLMGLLIPSSGRILVDGQFLTGKLLRAWQRNIAHVPQNIFLADATLPENIAFGVQSNAMDMQRVQQAAHQAQIADFIESRPEGYSSYVGERGIRLSGGQRQRIGIARALYKQATILLFDEATSALDNVTEQSVMDTIEKLDSNLTILIIAHRLSTLRRCDTILELGEGKVVAQGPYDNLIECSASFRSMAESLNGQKEQAV